MNNDYNNGQNNPGFGEQQNPGFGEPNSAQNGNSWTNNTQSSNPQTNNNAQNGNSWTNNAQNGNSQTNNNAQSTNSWSGNNPQGGNQGGYTAPGAGGQNYYYQPGYTSAPAPQKPVKDYGSTAQTLGIISLVASLICGCLPIIGLVLGIFAIVNGNRARGEGQDANAGTVGRVCGIIAIVISVICIVVSVIYSVLILGGAMDSFWGAYYDALNSLT